MKIQFDSLGWVDVTPDIAQAFKEGAEINISVKYDDDVKGVTQCNIVVGNKDSHYLESIYHALGANIEDLQKILEVISSEKDYFELRLGTAHKRKHYSQDIKKRIRDVARFQEMVKNHPKFKNSWE